MRNFNFQRLTALILAFAVSSALADVISMRGNAKLSGEVIGMASDGTITLLSPASVTPLSLSAKQVERVVFDYSGIAAEIPEQRLELINGDILPVKVTSMEQGLLKVESSVLGDLSIPREAVSSLQLGIVAQKVIYPGAEGIVGWYPSDGGSHSWEYRDNAFFADGYGIHSHDDLLPEKFILRFNFSWAQNPNFQFVFAQAAKAQEDKTGRYIAEISGSGMGLFRENANRLRTPIIMLARSPEQNTNRLIQVEIRMDRKRGLMELRIDGELEGRYTDPIQPMPRGNGISLVSQSSGESGQSVKDIQILSWDDRGDRHKSEEKGEGKGDSLIGRFGERFGGKLESIRPNGNSTVYVFKSDFQREPLELPEEEVSTLFFGKAGKNPQSEKNSSLLLNLRGQGAMRVSSCVVVDDSVKIEHPLLGSLQFARAGLSSLERILIPKAKPVNNR
jgi:hypothetical protein